MNRHGAPAMGGKQQKAKDFSLFGECYSSVKEAFEQAKKQALATDVIFVGGSTFVVAEVV